VPQRTPKAAQNLAELSPVSRPARTLQQRHDDHLRTAPSLNLRRCPFLVLSWFARSAFAAGSGSCSTKRMRQPGRTGHLLKRASNSTTFQSASRARPCKRVRHDKTSTQTYAKRRPPRGQRLSAAGQGGPVDACECPFRFRGKIRVLVSTCFVHLFSFQLLLPRMYISIDLGQLITQPAHLQSLFHLTDLYHPYIFNKQTNKQRHLSSWKKARENMKKKKKRRRKFSFLNRRWLCVCVCIAHQPCHCHCHPNAAYESNWRSVLCSL